MSIDEVRDELVFQYNVRLDRNRPLVVAIDGLGGAGKTTLVKEIERELIKTHNISVIHIDDHIVEKDKRYSTGYEEWYEYYFLQWDIEMIAIDILEKIYNHQTEITLPFYIKSADTIHSKNYLIQSNSIVLIEGVFLQREEWKTFFDYVIFIDCPKEVRHKRLLNRDLYIGDSEAIINKYKRRYWPAEAYYLKNAQPMNNADKIYTVI